MGKFAPVAPIQVLEDMAEQGVLGDYHLLLAHHVLEYPDRFRDLFNKTSRCTIIMDNSIVELGDAENESKVLEACKVIQPKPHEPNWVIPVLTDVMGDGEATREAIAKSFGWWMDNAEDWPLMAVLQGDSWKDFCKTTDEILLDPGYERITYAGIPRVLTATLGTRFVAIQYVEAVRPDINVHLLGFSDDVADDVICSNHPSVEGIDSAVPIRYSYSDGGDGLYTPTSEIPPRPKDWFEKGTFDDASYTNLQRMRIWTA